jgi:hypothetical protein
MTGSMKRLGIHAQRHCRLILTTRVWPERILPPPIQLTGHTLSQEAKAAALANREG